MKAESRFLTSPAASHAKHGHGIAYGNRRWYFSRWDRTVFTVRCSLVEYDASNTSVFIDAFFEDEFLEMTRLLCKAQSRSSPFESGSF